MWIQECRATRAAVACLFAGLASLGACGEPETETAVGGAPVTVLDESVPDWRVDRFAGNSMGGQQFVQGPARQTAGPYGPVAACAPDGTAFACWDPFRKALWCGGPDETRFRWLKDGWVKTVLPVKRGGDANRKLDGVGVKSEEMGEMMWVYVRGVDSRGNVYLYSGGSPTGLWRAYRGRSKEVEK